MIQRAWSQKLMLPGLAVLCFFCVGFSAWMLTTDPRESSYARVDIQGVTTNGEIRSVHFTVSNACRWPVHILAGFSATPGSGGGGRAVFSVPSVEMKTDDASPLAPRKRREFSVEVPAPLSGAGLVQLLVGSRRVPDLLDKARQSVRRGLSRIGADEMSRAIPESDPVLFTSSPEMEF
jgi:hypothetical protein